MELAQCIHPYIQLFGGHCSYILYRYSFDPVSATDVEAMAFMWHNGGRVVMGVYLTLLGPHDYYVNLNDYCVNLHGLYCTND
jgi:hypothetical protein